VRRRGLRVLLRPFDGFLETRSFVDSFVELFQNARDLIGVI
jgi:hypothetical protein